MTWVITPMPIIDGRGAAAQLHSVPPEINETRLRRSCGPDEHRRVRQPAKGMSVEGMAETVGPFESVMLWCSRICLAERCSLS